jgi:hypothetical protein
MKRELEPVVSVYEEEDELGRKLPLDEALERITAELRRRVMADESEGEVYMSLTVMVHP